MSKFEIQRRSNWFLIEEIADNAVNLTSSRNLRPFEYRTLTFNTAEEKERAEQLKVYFELREPCQFELNETSSSNNPNLTYCRSTADYLFCFPSVPVNTTLVFNCPFKKDLPISKRDGNIKIFKFIRELF